MDIFKPKTAVIIQQALDYGFAMYPLTKEDDPHHYACTLRAGAKRAGVNVKISIADLVVRHEHFVWLMVTLKDDTDLVIPNVSDQDDQSYALDDDL